MSSPEHHVQRYQSIGRMDTPRRWNEAVAKLAPAGHNLININ